MKGRAKPMPVERALSKERVLIIAEFVYSAREQISSDELESAIRIVRDAHKGKAPKKKS